METPIIFSNSGSLSGAVTSASTYNTYYISDSGIYVYNLNGAVQLNHPSISYKLFPNDFYLCPKVNLNTK